MYRLLIKPLLFLLSPESAHHFTFSVLKFLFRVPLSRTIAKTFFCVRNPKLQRQIAGLTFLNPVGLAAGFDKDARLFDEMTYLGFGFIEVGTVTPKPQPGNPKPRLFRLPDDEALINRMGFNNEGVDAVVERLRKRKNKNIIIGGNIGKNKTTPNENAFDDYKICFEKMFDVVDYFVVNVSSPNTPGLRELQDKKPLTGILTGLQKINNQNAIPKPLLLKIAPDLTNEQLDDIIDIVKETKINGVVATNTTIAMEKLHTPGPKLRAIGTGGLSGKPLAKRSTEVIRYLSQKSSRSFLIMGVGGIHSAHDALEKLNAGADVIQLYTGIIYKGPSLVKKICRLVILNSEA